MVINTPSSGLSRFDDKVIRQESYKLNIPVITTIPGARSTIEAMKEVSNSELTVSSLQDYYEHLSSSFVQTVKESPKDAEVISHQLLIRAGMIKKLASGIIILPMGQRVLLK